MLIGSIQIELYIPGSSSLKEKRVVVQSIKKRIRNKFNVSIAEIDYQDKWQRVCLGISSVSNKRKHLDDVISNVINAIDRDDRIEIIDQFIEIL